MVLNSCKNLVITKYKLNSQYVKLTQLWPLTYHKIVKICFFCIYLDQMIVQQRVNVLFQIQLYDIFTIIFSIIFTNILQIHELPKIDNKIP